ncbi:MAG: DUF1523 family protein [Oligoflexus sp.]
MLVVVIVLICGLGLALSYYLPSTKLVALVGTEVKRRDLTKKGQEGRSRDVRYIIARDLKTEETLMFRNEDMGWPPHFKFDSGSLTGHVMNLKENRPDATVLVTYYGWRIPLLSAYPNITDVEVVDPDYRHIPWFNLIFLAAMFILFVMLYLKVQDFLDNKIFRRRRQSPVENESNKRV